jgi:hypothetical protein
MEIVKKDQETPEQNEAQALMIETLMETFLPKIKPFIAPATKKFTEFMQDDNMIMAKIVNGKVFFFHIKESSVSEFTLKADPINAYDIESFIEKIISGKFSDISL